MFLEAAPDLNRKKLITVPPRGAGGGSLVVKSMSEGQGGQPTPRQHHRPPLPTTTRLPPPPSVATGGPLCPQTGRWRHRVGPETAEVTGSRQSGAQPLAVWPLGIRVLRWGAACRRVGLSTGRGTPGGGRHRAAQQARVGGPAFPAHRAALPGQRCRLGWGLGGRRRGLLTTRRTGLSGPGPGLSSRSFQGSVCLRRL